MRRDDDFLQRVQKFATGFERFAVGAVDHQPRWGDGVLRSKRKRCMRQAEQCAIQLIISAFLHLNNNNWSVVGQFCCSVVLLLTSSMKCTPLVLFVVVVAVRKKETWKEKKFNNLYRDENQKSDWTFASAARAVRSIDVRHFCWLAIDNDFQKNKNIHIYIEKC